MGIQGLLPLLKSIQKPTHLRNFAGQTLGVDAYGWLHRGTVSCAIELAQQKPTRKHIEFALSRVRMLIHFGVKPYMVFDGAYLPSKEHTEKERATKRNESKKLGLELLNMGRIPQAYLELQKAIDVTPSMARELIEELKRLDVPYVVAPYEADSQLAYLEKQSIISGVISEDSDLLVFGVKCLLTKLDQYGECVMVNRADFTACREISLVGWTDKEFRMMAMLSGCDYLPGIDKMGLKTAYRLVRQHKTIERIIRAVQFDGKMKVPVSYLEAFNKAERTFLYQRVFCSEARRLVHLNKLPAELENESMPYIGENVEPELAVGVAIADLDPNTKKPLTFSSTSRQMPASRSRPVQTPDEKLGKPISEFFKPVRTPLAELDPNSFTPSPSQQALLTRQQSISWSASRAQVMRPPVLSRTAMSNVTSSAPQAARRTQSEQLSSMGRKSPKRQRLCSDRMLAASMDGTADLRATTSRFFKPKEEYSPSFARPATRRRKTTDFELWSDDSAVEVMAEIAAIEEVAVSDVPTPKKRKKIQVYADCIPEARKEVAVGASVGTDFSQDTIDTSASGLSQSTANNQTLDTSFEVEDARTNRNVFSEGIEADYAALKAKYGFRTTSPRRNFSQAKPIPLAGRIPLQEGGPSRELRGRSEQIVSFERRLDTSDQDAYTNGEKSKREGALVPNSSPGVDSGTIGLESRQHDGTLDNDGVIESPRNQVKPEDLTTKGSEDFLIPNSPDSVEDGRGNRPNLNLGQYVFAGQS